MAHFSDLNAAVPKIEQKFKVLIAKIRNHLVREQQNQERFIDGVPVLPKRPNYFLRLQLNELGTNGFTSTLIFRESDLYLVGYIGLEGHVFKLQDAHDLVVNPANQTILPFEGSYGGLTTAANLSCASKTNVGEVILSNSLRRLSTPGRSNRDIASALLTIVVMLCESCRFVSIERFVANSFSVCDRPIGVHEMSWVNKWAKLSKKMKNGTISLDDKANMAILKVVV